MPRKVRDYKKERASYDSKPKVMAANRARKKARYEMEKAGKVKKFDGKDVDHKKPLSKGGSTKKTNLRVVSASKNRSYARTKKGAIK
jgi:hypothetical protein